MQDPGRVLRSLVGIPAPYLSCSGSKISADRGTGGERSPPVRNVAQLLGVEHWPKLNDQFAPPDDECSTAATFATGPPLGPRMLKNAVSVVTNFPEVSKFPPNHEAPASR